MADSADSMNAMRGGTRSLRVVHVMRAPVGGLFRHVTDLAREQARAGHKIGLIVDKTTGGARAECALERLAPHLALGIARISMKRLPHWSDPLIAHRVARSLDAIAPDVVHGHGAKGGLYARLPAIMPHYPAPQRPVVRVYTPHGGSLHFAPTGVVNRALIFVEKALEGVTDLIPFESDFARKRFIANIGLTRARAIVAHNGLARMEFEPVEPSPDAADFLYVGEMRRFKGIDTLLEALAQLNAGSARPMRLALVGAGPEETELKALAASLGLADSVAFHAPMDARAAFRLGRVIVTPSRAESLPYIVLEAIAARLAIVATRVGGVPEIFGPFADLLVPSDDAGALAAAMRETALLTPEARAARAAAMAHFVEEHFSLIRMVETIVSAYREAILAAAPAGDAARALLADAGRSGDLAK
jgi:glycosyltransferase involved in cell wall biosynthesis